LPSRSRLHVAGTQARGATMNNDNLILLRMPSSWEIRRSQGVPKTLTETFI